VTRRARIAFAVVVTAMVALPLGTIAWNEWKLSSGKRVILQVEPVDPLDPFRGEYVALSYPIGSIGTRGLETGQTVYVPLHKSGDHWSGHEATATRPDGAVTFIRGRIIRPGAIEYGIETFYVEEGQARKYEQAMFDRRLDAEVVLDDDGKARLDDLVIRPE
jgi:uncharacterized membrane-anchored protein